MKSIPVHSIMSLAIVLFAGNVALSQPVYEAWIARYNGPGNVSDFAYDLAVDASGNVYVTGISGVSPNYDYATVKYDASGVQQWVARYNGPGNSGDYANALSVDASGNVYVTGYSYDPVTFNDYATVKYDASGIQQWVARYNGPGNNHDYANALAVDASGNVFVTGYVFSSVNAIDYATIKYDASGVQQWVALYDGPGNNTDIPHALAVDASGNIYVTGGSEGDYATIKYDASGVEQWVARYNGPGNFGDVANDLAVDASGNVYVTGESEGYYATIKYDASGVQQWVARYTVLSAANALAVDASGNVCVTGSSYSGTLDDYLTIKYDASGVQQWVARYDGEGHYYDNDYAYALAVDTTGNVYVTGHADGGNTSYDYVTLKYNASGVPQWIARYNSPGNGPDGANALALDASGNVYVTGYSSSGTHYDYATIKYVQGIPPPVTLSFPPHGAIITSDSLRLIWNQNPAEPDRYWLEGDTDSLFSTPFTDSLLTDTAYTLFPLHHNTMLWWRVKAHNSFGWGSFSEVRSFFVYQEIPAPPVLVDPPDSAVGVSPEPTLRWNPSLGSQSYTIQVSDAPDFSSLIVNGEGADTSYQASNLQNDMTYYWRVNAVNDLGTSEWSDVWSFHTALGPPAQVLLVSPENGSLVVIDSITFQWHKGTPDVDKYWFEISIDSSFTSSIIDSTITDTTHTISQLNDETEYFWKVKAHNAAGWGPFSQRWNFHILLEGVKNEEQVPREYSLSQNYPNPFNPTTVIQYGLPKRSHVKLELFSLIGQRVVILVDADKEPGYHSAVLKRQNLASGLYFYRLSVIPTALRDLVSQEGDGQAGSFVETKKLIILR